MKDRVIEMEYKRMSLDKQKRLRALAVLMVMVIMISSVTVLLTNSEGYYPGDGTGGSITYYLGDGVYAVDEDGDISSTPTSDTAYLVEPNGTVSSTSAEQVSVRLSTYFGLKSTEYNPEFWSGWGEVPMFTGSKGMMNWVGPLYEASWEVNDAVEITVSRGNLKGDVTFTLPSEYTRVSGVTSIPNGQASTTITVTINYSGQLHKVFGGWSYHEQPETMVYPGEIVSLETTELDAKWVEPVLYAKKSITLVSNGETITGVTPYAELTPGSENVLTVNPSDYCCNTNDNAKTMFNNIYWLNGTKEYQLKNTVVLPTGTYRTANPYNVYDYTTRAAKIDYKAVVSIYSNYGNLGADAIFDNISFKANSTNTHGGSSSAGLFANGHRLILGTNISTVDYETGGISQHDKVSRAPVIFGGAASSEISTKIQTQTVYLNDLAKSHFNVDIGTFVIIHSGVYNNIIAGGLRTVGSQGTPLSTYAVLKDCIAIDTVGGGGGAGTGHVYGHISEQSGYMDGGAFVYAVGLFTVGDQWQDSESGYMGTVTGKYADGTSDAFKANGNTRQYILNQQSSVVQGGCHQGKLNGSSHLIITGKSSVWDCMGGGRDAISQTDYAYLEITGKAEVRRVACGTITDGSTNDRNPDCVGDARIYVAEDPIIASIYGAGFDTWAYPSGKSMMDGTITVDIDGGRIGDVFGGGYRGSIGTPNDLTKLKINIHISGDETVIEGNVYGGGSGGLNKIKHLTTGEGFQTGSGVDGDSKSTGRSYVYGDIDLTIDGGTVYGNVYGGGMSVPKLASYVNVYNDDKKTTPTVFVQETVDGKPCEPATVFGNVTVTIGGNAKIMKSVYGAGQGLMMVYDEDQKKYVVDESQYGFNKVVYKDGNDRTISRQYWVVGGENLTNRSYDNSSNLSYDNYAQVRGNTIVIIENESWYHVRTPVIGDNYTVASNDADGQGFIVLYRGTTLPAGFNVVKITDDSYSMTTLPDGASVEGVDGWNVKGETIEGTYTVNPLHADLNKTIILYNGSFSSQHLNVLKIDDTVLTVDRNKSVNNVVDLQTSVVTESVYGGGGYSKVYGTTMVNIDSGIVKQNVYGGGLGLSEKISIEGNRVVFIENNTSIHGSVYGGSEHGIDGEVISEQDLNSTDPLKVQDVQSKLNKSRAGVVIQGGFIEGSVFGGGLMGKTYGNTKVFIGYYLPSLNVRTPTPNTYPVTPGLQISVSSVFAGGNVSTSDDDTSISKAYEYPLVQGSGLVRIYGDVNRHVSISGSIMGSGNACLTRGETGIEIINLFDASSLSAIHRATTVTIDGCNIDVLGRNPITDIFGQNKNVSLYKIGELILKSGSSVRFSAPIDDIGSLKSYTANDFPTTDKSPINRLVFNNGPTVYIRSMDSAGVLDYRHVEGFVQMVSTTGTYGAYALARADSSGGFSVAGDSALKEADTSVSGTMCCWYMSGISKKIATMSLQVENDRGQESVESHVTITKFQPSTVMMYTGGVFTKMSNDANGDPYTFVRPGSESIKDNPSQLSLAIGYKPNSLGGGIALYDPTYRQMSITGDGEMTSVQGTFFKKDNRESDAIGSIKNRSLVSVPMSYYGGSRTIGDLDIYMCLSGRPVDGTSYVGYLTLIFQEVQEIKYDAIDESTGQIVEVSKYLIANTIELRVDIYIYGSPNADRESFRVEVKTTPDENDYRDGYASALIPQSYQMAEMNVADVLQIGAGSGEMPDVALKDSVAYIFKDCGYIATPGKSFSNWKISSGGESRVAKPGDTITISGNTATITGQPNLTIVDNKIKIIPEWTTQVDLVFDPNGGTGTVTTIPIVGGMEYELPSIQALSFTAPDGMAFAYWSVTSGADREESKATREIFTIDGDTVVKAVWATERTITFNAGSEGTGSMSSVKWADGVRYTMPACGFTPNAGYTFDHWDVSGKTEYPGETTTVSGDLSATAIWVRDNNNRTVTFNPNGGTGGPMGPVYVASGSTYCLPSCTFSAPAGKIFKEWTVTVEGSSNNYRQGDFVAITSDTTITAVWVTKLEISFAAGTNSTGTMVSQYSPYEDIYRIPEPNGITAVASYYFDHWIDSRGIAYYPGQIIEPRSNLSLTAVCYSDAEKTNKVAFESNNGTGYMAVLKKSVGSTYTLPNCDYEAPKGKVFSHWLVKIGGGNAAVMNPGEPITVSANMIVQAQWYAEKTEEVENFWTITIKETNVSDPALVLKIKKDAFYVLPDNIFDIPSGKVFKQWTVTGTITNNQVKSDLTLVPEWETAASTLLDMDSGRTVYGKVIIKAESNQDNTTGWSNLGENVVWDLRSGLEGDNRYVGTLLGNIVANISYTVEGLSFTDSMGDPYLPVIDLCFDRSGVRAHTILSFADIQNYRVVFIDHGLETERYYPENTLLTHEQCNTPTSDNFNGWYLDENYVNRYEYNMVINDESDGLRLYGRYTYIVTLDNMNGTTYTLYVSEDKNGAILTEKELPIPEYIGYKFAGWCKDRELIYDWGYQSDRVTGDTTLYARWIGEDVRVYFWFYDSSDKLRLFDGTKEGQAAVDGYYNLQNAYMLNADRKLYPTVSYGSTFDVKDPYHGGKNILDYAEETIDFSGSFVKWTVVSPKDPHVHIGIYDDTVVGPKVLTYVTKEMRQGTVDLWEYYLYHDGGYPRVDWVGDNRPDTMEIHLLADTTKVAIKITMGLDEDDEKYSPTINIDDPEEFLV